MVEESRHPAENGVTGEPRQGDRMPKALFHTTRITSLVDIIASRGLLPAAWRAEEKPLRHKWGENEAEGKELVCLSFRPSWAILTNHFLDEEAAILRFDPRNIWRLMDVRPCPMNSWERAAGPYVGGEVEQEEALRECLASQAQLHNKEVLVAGGLVRAEPAQRASPPRGPAR